MGTLAKPKNLKSSNKSKKDGIPDILNYNNKDVWSPSKVFRDIPKKCKVKLHSYFLTIKMSHESPVKNGLRQVNM